MKGEKVKKRKGEITAHCMFYLFAFSIFHLYNTVAASRLALSLKAVVSAVVSP